MSAAPDRVHLAVDATRRRFQRYTVTVPVDVTVLRSGIPDCIPGRALDVGEGGMAAIVAGELRPGDTVGAEFRLPDVASPLRAKAVVRHQDRLRCGVEFVGLSPEQKAVLRYWGRQAAEEQRKPAACSDAPATPSPSQKHGSRTAQSAHRKRIPTRLLWTVAVILLLLGVAGWWHWYQAWAELESAAPARAIPVPPTRVPTAAIEPLVIHKVDPVYPSTVARTQQPGIVLLDAVIGSDGSVIQARPISGPSDLTSAAVDAVRWWRFQPYKMDGRPVEVETTLAVNFP